MSSSALSTSRLRREVAQSDVEVVVIWPARTAIANWLRPIQETTEATVTTEGTFVETVLVTFKTKSFTIYE